MAFWLVKNSYNKKDSGSHAVISASAPVFEGGTPAASPLWLCTFPPEDYIAALTFFLFSVREEDVPRRRLRFSVWLHAVSVHKVRHGFPCLAMEACTWDVLAGSGLHCCFTSLAVGSSVQHFHICHHSPFLYRRRGWCAMALSILLCGCARITSFLFPNMEMPSGEQVPERSEGMR